VLLIDLDQQADLTALFGFGPANLEATLVDALAPVNALPVRDALVRDVHGVSGLDLLPSDLRAAALEKQLAGELMREQRLGALLAPVLDEYAEVLIDCPPSLGDLTLNGLCAADEVLVPVNMKDKNAVQGAVNLAQTIVQLRAQRQPVRLRALVRVQVNHKLLAYDALNRALDVTGLPIAKTEVLAREDWNSAIVEGCPVMLWRPMGDAGRDVRMLAHELWPSLSMPWPSDVRRLMRADLGETPRAAA
jgi:chromosome partitioning protein